MLCFPSFPAADEADAVYASAAVPRCDSRASNDLLYSLCQAKAVLQELAEFRRQRGKASVGVPKACVAMTASCKLYHQRFQSPTIAACRVKKHR